MQIRSRKLRRGDEENDLREREYAAMTPAQRIGRSWVITQALYRIRGIDVSSRALIDLLRSLNAVKARYLVVGAAALAAYGQIRGADDFDIWVDRSPENARLVYRALADFGAPLDDLTVDDLQSADLVFQIGISPIRVDIHTDTDGIQFGEAWPNRLTTEDDGVEFSVISRTDLIRNKRATGRPQDLVDIEMLELPPRDAKNT